MFIHSKFPLSANSTSSLGVSPTPSLTAMCYLTHFPLVHLSSLATKLFALTICMVMQACIVWVHCQLIFWTLWPLTSLHIYVTLEFLWDSFKVWREKVLCYCVLVVKSYKRDFSMGFTFQGTNVELHRSLKLFVSWGIKLPFNKLPVLQLEQTSLAVISHKKLYITVV